MEVVVVAGLLALGGRGAGGRYGHLCGRDVAGDELGLGVLYDLAPLGKCGEVAGEAELAVPEARDGRGLLDAFIA